MQLSIKDALIQALEHQQAGNLQEAERIARQVLAIDPGQSNAHYLLGVVAHQFGRNEDACHHLERAAAQQPGNARIHDVLGLVYQALGRLNDARASHEAALSLEPNSSKAHSNLGVVLASNGKLDEAIVHFEQAVTLDPRLVQGHYNLGRALGNLGHLDAAVIHYQKVLQLQPEHYLAHNNIGDILIKMGKFDLALDRLNEALRLKPDFVTAYCNLSSVLLSLGRIAESVSHSRRALALDPDLAAAHWNEALALLRLGDFERGFAKYEWRWKVISPPPKDYPGQAWQGEPLVDQTILLYAEQGFGDVIQMLRYVPLMIRLGARVIVEVPQALVRLVKTTYETVEVVPRGAALPPYDVHCALMSLPFRFQTRLDTIPAAVPYLSAAPALVGSWRQRIDDDGRRTAGLVWAGESRNMIDPRRSLPVDMLALLLDVPGIRWFSLQVGDRANDLQLLSPDCIVDLSVNLTGFAETAAAMANLDLIVSVDTAAAHLAGALGKPVWLLNRFDADWRWLLDREDSPWYPSMRIFRQSRLGDWGSVIAHVTGELARFVEKSS